MLDVKTPGCCLLAFEGKQCIEPLHMLDKQDLLCLFEQIGGVIPSPEGKCSNYVSACP